MKLAIIFAEFGKAVPDISQYRECWPEAEIQLFTASDLPHVPQFDGPRYGWRMNDYWKVRQALDSGADIAMTFDADMRIVDFNAARELPRLAEVFGVCLPINPRYTAKRDFLDGADAGACTDQTVWNGPSVNCSPIAINLRDVERRELAEEYCREMLEEPVRGPVAWWRAMLTTGIAPLILPPQWCVCEKHIGIDGPIILHEGHAVVKRHYAGMEPK